MIQSILEPITTLTSNSATVTFTSDDVRTRSANCCSWLQHSEGSPIYKIISGGLYEVSFNANVTSSVAGTIALGLFQDGVLIPGTQVIAQITTVGDYVNVSFDKLIKVCCNGSATLTNGNPKSWAYIGVMYFLFFPGSFALFYYSWKLINKTRFEFKTYKD